MLTLEHNFPCDIEKLITCQSPGKFSLCEFLIIYFLMLTQQTFVGLQDFLKTSSRHVLKTSSTRLQRNNFLSSKMSWKRLENVLKTSWRHILKMSWRYVLKTSWRHILKTSRWHVLKTPWRHVLKTSSRRLGDKKNGDICISQI